MCCVASWKVKIKKKRGRDQKEGSRSEHRREAFFPWGGGRAWQDMGRWVRMCGRTYHPEVIRPGSSST